MGYLKKFSKFEDAIKDAHTLGDKHCTVIGSIENGTPVYYVGDDNGSVMIRSFERLIYDGQGKNAKGEAIPN